MNIKNKEQIYMVFDVESIGLHGEGFAVGWVVINGYGVEISHGLIACDPALASGSDESREWCSKNIPVMGPNVGHPSEVRNNFWRQWESWQKHGAILVADCGWPVEARFLSACVDESPEERQLKGPYPLIDLGSILFANSTHPLTTFARMDNERPEHNPLADSRQSARILIESISSSR